MLVPPSLIPNLSLLRKMIDKAWEWAKNQGPTKFRTNAIHGEEEVRIVLSDTFEHEDVDIEENQRTGTMEVEDPKGRLRAIHVPNHISYIYIYIN